MPVWSLDWKGLLEEGMATHSSSPDWRIPWTEEPGGLQSIGHSPENEWSDLAHMHRNWRQNRVPRVQNKNTHNKQSPREKPAQNPPNHLPGRVKKAPTYWPTPPRRSLRCQTTSSHPNHQGCQSSCPEKCFHSQLQIPWKQRKKQKISAKKQTLYKTKKKPNGKNTITEIKKLTRRALVEWRWWSLWAAGCTAEFTPSERERKERDESDQAHCHYK